MALHADDESKTGTLPDPELNPLLNPLLAANMGRWAEVYFTNPPERRAQAVADLLRELEKNPPPQRHADVIEQSSPETMQGKIEDVFFRPPLESEASVICAACGHANRTEQRFCGMCGMPLAANEPPSGHAEAEFPREKSWHDQSPFEPEIPESSFKAESSPSYASIPLPSFASLSEDSDSDDANGLFHYESGRPRRSYRVYIGLALAIVLGLLVYKTWRGNSSLRANHGEPAPVPQESAPAQAATPTPAATAPPPAKEGPNDSAAASADAAPAKQEETSNKPTPRKPAPSRGMSAAPENTITANPAEPGGEAELAVGQKYLNGGPGAARDPREASTWLWRAVAKKNPAATLLLSDLYLRGDGVAKSCDQARLLLDAAARKGNAAAAERLRNLPAFGCQ